MKPAAARGNVPRSTRDSEVAERLRMTIARIVRRLRQQTNPGLTPSLASVLATLETHGPMTPSDLAVRERISRPSVTSLVSRLEADGLVRREADPVDARSHRVTVTPRGLSLLTKTRNRRQAFLTRAVGALDDDELALIEQAVELLERMLERAP